MILKEYLFENNLIDSLRAVTNLDVFAVKGKTITIMLKHLYGLRILFNPSELSCDELAEVIALQYGEKWRNTISALKTVNDMGIDSNGKGGERVERVIDGKRSTNRNDNNQVQTFNNTMQNDNVKTGEDNDQYESKEVIIKSNDGVEFKTPFENLTLLNQNHIIEIIVLDIANLITLSVYNED